MYLVKLAKILDDHEGRKRDIPSENDSTSALDVIVEATVRVAVAVQVAESLFTLKVLKLDNHVRVDLLGGLHELVHELLLDANRGALLAQAKVERILEVVLVVCTAVQDDGQSLVGVDTGGGSVQRKLADLDYC